MFLIGANQYFGQEEILERKSARESQVTVESEVCAFYRINYEIFYNFLRTNDVLKEV